MVRRGDGLRCRQPTPRREVQTELEEPFGRSGLSLPSSGSVPSKAKTWVVHVRQGGRGL